MKKVLLLAGVATLFSVNANAFNWNNQEVRPYIGMDYVYSYADYKKVDHKPQRSYNSIGGNIGAQLWEYFGPEFYYQYAFKRTSGRGDDKIKNRFYSYGMDIMGYLPLGCEGKINALGSIGLGGYNIKTTHSTEGSNDSNKIGYRFGLGAQYNLTDHISARLMGRYDYVGARYLDDIWEATVGMRYTF